MPRELHASPADEGPHGPRPGNRPRARHDSSADARAASARRPGPPPGRNGVAAAVAVLAASAFAAGLPFEAGAQEPGAEEGADGAREVAAADGLKGAGTRSFTQNGVRFRVDLVPAATDGATRPIREKEYFDVRVAVTDAESGQPVTDEKPAAWIDNRRSSRWDVPQRQCKQRINGYLPQRMKTQPVVDLNGYVVLTMNRGNHLSVLDPFFGFGSTNVKAAVKLSGAGRDWVKGQQGRHVYVTIPNRNKVVDVRAGRWEVQKTATVGTRPGRIVWGPDREMLWVASDGGAESGVTLVDPETLEVVDHVPTGPGPHEVVVRRDGEHVYVSNPPEGTVSVIDPSVPEVVATLETGSHPADLAYSSHSDHLYVVDDRDGTVMIYDTSSLELSTRITGSEGLWRIDFDPSGRWGFLMNRRTDELHVLDAEVDEVEHGVVTEGKPDQVHFTENFAYVRSRESSSVMMIGLRSLKPGRSGGAFAKDFRGEGEIVQTETGIAAVHFPAGAQAPNKHGDPGIAPAMALAPHKHDAIYVTNPTENSVYFYHYMEGMPTPNRNLKTYKFEPKSAMTVGRDLDEVEPGVYAATVKVPAAGHFSLNMVLDEPRVIECLSFDVEKDPSLATSERDVTTELRAVSDREIVAGREGRVAFRVVDRGTEETLADLETVVARISSPTGWQRTVETEKGDDGTFAAPVTVPDPGVYYLSARIPELNKGYQDQHYLVLRAVEPGSGGDQGETTVSSGSGSPDDE